MTLKKPKDKTSHIGISRVRKRANVRSVLESIQDYMRHNGSVTTLKVGVYVEWIGRLLLIRERNLKNGKLLWNIIKGSVEKTDDTLYDAAIRECREEAGVKVKPCGVFGISYRRRRINPVTQVNLLASSTSGHTKLAAPIRQRNLNEEIVEVRYFTKAELLKLERRECMNDRVWRGVRKWTRR